MKKTYYWRIDGFDGSAKIFCETIPGTHITNAELISLLRALVAKYGQLTDHEMVGSYLRRRIRGRLRHLEVTRSASLPPTFSCGDNVHFIATAYVEESTPCP